MERRLLWLVLILLTFGLVVLASASVVKAAKEYGSAGYFWKHQLIFGILPGLAALFICRSIPYKFWRRAAFPLLVASLVLLVLVFNDAIGIRLQGATSWLVLGGIRFQPAELLKLALVVYLAAWMSASHDRLKQWQLGLLPFVLIMGFIGILLVLQPDLGTLGVVLLMSAGIYFIAGAPWKHVIIICLSALILIGAVAVVSPERWSRVTTVFNPSADVRGAGWQLNQALIAIGNGGLWGVGYGESVQKFGLLPEPVGDSIFAVLVEELGVVGGITTVMLFIVLAFTLMQIARRAPDAFGALLASGMLMWVSVQALVNMLAITGLGPLTGIPLPFISYGGTSMVSLLAGMGIAMNVARHSR
jgi:cell division protein FtsW